MNSCKNIACRNLYEIVTWSVRVNYSGLEYFINEISKGVTWPKTCTLKAFDADLTVWDELY